MNDFTEPRDRLRLTANRPLSLISGHKPNGIIVDETGEASAPRAPRPALTSIAVSIDGDWIEATATLALNGRVLNGSGAGDAADRTAIVAAATLNAVSALLDCPAFLENAIIVDVEGRDVALTIVRLESFEGTEVLVGSAMVRGDLGDATARSVLSALNRRLSR